jgi:hypothetical protein
MNLDQRKSKGLPQNKKKGDLKKKNNKVMLESLQKKTIRKRKTKKTKDPKDANKMLRGSFK